MKRIELLSPAGNLEKAKIALLYGADACYVGLKKFSLRARASNFDFEDLIELTDFAAKRGKKIYVTTNIFPHDEDFTGLDGFLIDLEKANVTGIITSSLYIISRALIIAPKLERHISTQLSITNNNAIDYLKKYEIKRVVLARELSIKQIGDIAKNTDIELEVFIHGGMCSSISGRCSLSNHMTNRDANRGGCAHSCRWNYYLDAENNPQRFFNMGSKDLMAIDYIEDLIKLNVSSLKVEGRMKSLYYLATVIKSYRTVIDYYYEHQKVSPKVIADCKKEILKAENRKTSIGFFDEFVTKENQLYDDRYEHPTKEFVGIVHSYDENSKLATIEQRNYFEVGDTLEFFGPDLDNTDYIVERIYSLSQEAFVDVARHPLEILQLEMPFTVSENCMIRKKIRIKTIKSN